MENAFSNRAIAASLIQACLTLRVMRERNCADRCKENGGHLLEAIRAVVGEENARGIGYCIWVDKNLDRLPILSSIHGRLLPRFEQSSDTIHTIRTQFNHNMQSIFRCGKAAVRLARIFSCALCGDQCRDTEECTQCLSCTRQWHDKCAAKAVKGKADDYYECRCSR